VDLQHYRALGPLILPPQSVVSNSLHYADGVHLNAEGAKALVPFLAERIAALATTPPVPAIPDQKLSAEEAVK
jgi:lysophospholipase L1-like esterase